jgi:hypothetical protein
MDEETIERVAIWPENDAGIERYIPQADRDKIDSADFAGPDRSFPIDTQAHLDAAAHLIGHAADPAAVKAKAIRIAKRKGFTLPKAWQEGGDDKKEARDTPIEDTPPDRVASALTASDRISLYMPIVRISDNDDWLVEGQATSDEVDSYETIFDYESSKKAFDRWRGNVREMHQRQAVGRGIKWIPDDDNKRIVLRSRVSKGAPDTWQKIRDGVLNGYSVALKPGFKEKYTERNGHRILTYYDFDYAEVSLVDSPGSPNCDIAIVRADGMATEVLDTSEQEAVSTTTAIEHPEPVERVGARVSSDTKSAVHGARDSAMQSAMQMMKVCDCPDCQAMTRALDPDQDGDIDVPGADSTLDPDHDASKMAERIASLLIARMVQELHSPISRMHAIAGTFARSHAPEIDISPIQRSLESIVSRLETVPTTANLDEVRSALAEVKGQVEVIARQPAAGGPILNGARPVDKSLAPNAYQPPATDTYAVLERLQAAGVLNTQEKQVAAAALAIVPTRGRIG